MKTLAILALALIGGGTAYGQCPSGNCRYAQPQIQATQFVQAQPMTVVQAQPQFVPVVQGCRSCHVPRKRFRLFRGCR